MEQIAKLLQDFEAGKMNRRQLIGSLALAATAAAVAGPAASVAWAAQASAGVRTFPVTTVNHLSYDASDYARTRDFYVDLLGMRVVWDDGRRCALEFGSLTSPNGIYLRSADSGAKPTINHIAFGLPNFMSHKTAIKAEIERRGLKNVKPDAEVGWICDDPNGYMLNIVAVNDNKAMFPGAGAPCLEAASQKCKLAYEAGLKNLNAAPKPSGKGFKAYAYSHVVLNCTDIPKAREFYQTMLGMKVVYDQPPDMATGRNAQVFLRFGQNTLYLRPAGADGKAYCNHFAFAIENYNQDAVEAELKRRGLDPQPDSKLAWSIKDPSGLRIEIAGWGLPEHIANDCHGANTTCPGGVKG
jgi:catechol 2,3-dioxygenase-like lactoylglutathione lyase family enzyme